MSLKTVGVALWSLFGKERFGWWAAKEAAEFTDTMIDDHFVAAAKAAREGRLDDAMKHASLAMDAIMEAMDQDDTPSTSARGDNPTVPPRPGG